MIPAAVSRFFGYFPNWLIGIALLAATAFLALALFQLAREFLRRFLEARHPMLHALLQRADSLDRKGVV